MGIYMASPWGFISGKLGDAVGSKVRGNIRIVRAYAKPIVPGTYEWLAKNEPTPKAMRHANLNHVVFPLLSHIAKQKLRDLILPVWKPLTRHKPYLTPRNLFMKYNVPTILHSIPNPFEFCNPENLPDLKRLCITFGMLEEAEIIDCSYSNGIFTVNWDTKCLRNGTPDDYAYIMAIYWNIIYQSDHSYQESRTLNLESASGGLPLSIKIWGDALHPLAKRENGHASLSIQEDLNSFTPQTPEQLHLFKTLLDEPCELNEPNQLTFYLFFSNPKIGYSISTPISP